MPARRPGDLTAEEQNEALEELIGMYAGSQEADKQKLGAGEPNARLELVGKSAMAELLFKKFTRRRGADRRGTEDRVRRAHRRGPEDRSSTPGTSSWTTRRRPRS